jgi:hypothetical protein
MFDSKPRDFSYMTHRENYPLEITGTMKRRARPPCPLNLGLMTPHRIFSGYVRQEPPEGGSANYAQESMSRKRVATDTSPELKRSPQKPAFE